MFRLCEYCTICKWQDCPAGLNFANEEEARDFNAAVEEKLSARQQRKTGKLKSERLANNIPQCETKSRRISPPLVILCKSFEQLRLPESGLYYVYNLLKYVALTCLKTTFFSDPMSVHLCWTVKCQKIPNTSLSSKLLNCSKFKCQQSHQLYFKSSVISQFHPFLEIRNFDAFNTCWRLCHIVLLGLTIIYKTTGAVDCLEVSITEDHADVTHAAVSW